MHFLRRLAENGQQGRKVYNRLEYGAPFSVVVGAES